MTHDDTMLEYVAQNMLEYVESLPLLVFVLGTFGSDSFKIRPVDRRHQDRSKHPYGGVLLVADSHLESRLADM